MASIFLGKQNGKTISVIMAKDFMAASEYWNANDIPVDGTSEVFNIKDFNEQEVIPFVTTERKMIFNASCTEEKEQFIIV